MSNYIKLHGHHAGVERPAKHDEEKTLHLRVDYIQEICAVPNDRHISYSEQVTKEEYEKNKDGGGYFFTGMDSGDTYWKYLPTSMITMGNFPTGQYSKNITLKVRAKASDIVDMVDQAIIDFEVRKALAVEAALNPPKKV